MMKMLCMVPIFLLPTYTFMCANAFICICVCARKSYVFRRGTMLACNASASMQARLSMQANIHVHAFQHVHMHMPRYAHIRMVTRIDQDEITKGHSLTVNRTSGDRRIYT
jgi:hypothetical protein